MARKTAHLSESSIDAIEQALFSRIADANTALRATPSMQWSSGALWMDHRTKGLAALREVLTYAESRCLKSPGFADSICALAARYFRERE